MPIRRIGSFIFLLLFSAQSLATAISVTATDYRINDEVRTSKLQPFILLCYSHSLPNLQCRHDSISMIQKKRLFHNLPMLIPRLHVQYSSKDIVLVLDSMAESTGRARNSD